MILQVKDIVKDAMGLIGCTEIDENPTSSEMSLGIRTANLMLSSWASKRLLLRSTTTISFSTIANKASYTIGAVGADVLGSKPLNIMNAYSTDANTDRPIEIKTKELYNNLSDKATATGIPEYLVYDKGASQQTVHTGTFYLYPMPEKVYTITVEADCYLTELVNPTDTITFEPIYYEALIYNLAMRLYRHYRNAAGPIPEDIVGFANNAVRSLKTNNHERIQSSMDLPPSIGAYNIYSDR